MPSHSIADLLSRQQELAARTSKVVGAFRSFRQALFDCLAKFAEEAAAQGLQGATRPEMARGEGDFVEWRMTINRYPLVMVTTNDAMPLDLTSDELVCRVFVYRSSEPEDVTPLAHIVFHEKANDQFAASIQWFTTEGPKSLGGTPPFTPELILKGGKDMADRLLDLMYWLRNSWVEKPLLSEIRKDHAAVRSLGFRT
jgi:hypothetical protein